MNLGKRTESKSYEKMVGFKETEVFAINPTAEQLRELGYNLEEDREIDYTGENEGNNTLRLNFKLKEKTGQHYDLNIYLEDKIVVSKDGNKTQWINQRGSSTWVDKEENLPTWFTGAGEFQYHEARIGEATLYDFMNSWLDIERSGDYDMFLNWKNLMSGNVSELQGFLKTDLPMPIVTALYVKTREINDEIREFQGVYKKVIPGWNMKFLRNTDMSEEGINNLRNKDKKYLKTHERFLLEVTDKQYGILDYFIPREAKAYNPDENIASGNKIMVDDPSY